MASVAGGSRLLVAPRNLRGFRGLTVDGYGALLRGGPNILPAIFARLFRDAGRMPDPAAENVWRRALRTHFAADPFIAFREVHRKVFPELFKQFGLTGDLEECIDEAFDGYRRVEAYPDVKSTLERLETEVPLAVVSNMDTMLLLQALHHNGLSFTFVVTSEEEQRYKPSPSIFQRAVRYLGLPAANILHVGDSYIEDVVGATSVGMGAVLLERGGLSRDPPPKSTPVVSDLRAVREFIRRSWD